MQRLIVAVGLILTSVPAAGAVERRRYNILFIGVDDLRPELGSYGSPDAKTPNVDALASRGVLFRHAYAQQAICGASRASLLTGTRPDTTRVLGLDYPTSFITDFIAAHPSLPRALFARGYWAQTMGKIHQGPPLDTAQLSASHGFPGGKIYAVAGNEQTRPPVESADVADAVYYDGALTNLAATSLRTAKMSGKPFFLGVGFQRPHLPFACPKRYFDLYDPARLALTQAPRLPLGAPIFAAASFELPQYQWTTVINPSVPIPETEARRLRHGYLACVSFIDAQIGRLLAELDTLGLRDDTVVVLWGDHGFHLGDQGAWGKHMNYEQATRSPLIVAVPGASGQGKTSSALVELVDIFPTLLDLTGSDVPDYVEGTSLVPLLDTPERPWKSAAFSQYPRGDIDGRAIRTARFRYVEWKQGGRIVGRELYDHDADPHEATTLAGRPEHAATVAELAQRLTAGWRAARPTTNGPTDAAAPSPDARPASEPDAGAPPTGGRGGTTVPPEEPPGTGGEGGTPHAPEEPNDDDVDDGEGDDDQPSDEQEDDDRNERANDAASCAFAGDRAGAGSFLGAAGLLLGLRRRRRRRVSVKLRRT